jgi:hypothetical protein
MAAQSQAVQMYDAIGKDGQTEPSSSPRRVRVDPLPNVAVEDSRNPASDHHNPSRNSTAIPLTRKDLRMAAHLPHSCGSHSNARRAFFGVVPIIAVVLGYGEVFMSQARTVEGVRNVVLVHGGFVDGSGWQGVYDVLKKDGYNVSIVQNPTTSLPDDVAVTKRTLAAQNGPSILVGHSYGGVVITEAGNDPKVAGLVYIAAFAPDKGESVSALIKNPPPGAPVPPILRLTAAICSSIGRSFERRSPRM